MSFSYILEKIKTADFVQSPFRYLQINDFFSDEHFSAITAAPEIKVSSVNSDEHLFDSLIERGYKIIDFPGCITNKDEYVKWHHTKATTRVTNTACEGFGVTLRLMSARTPIVTELIEFMNGQTFQGALAEKFGIGQETFFYDGGIQKYLDGYEISPHPDIRQKALTYMVNVNPSSDSERNDHHTHYLRFRDEYKYVKAYWEGNPGQERCWVPWDWCVSEAMQRENNSIVVFSPNNETMHGVKASYDHLSTQRTQLYGNFWHNKVELEGHPKWEDFVVGGRKTVDASWKGLVKSIIPETARDPIKTVFDKLRKSTNGRAGDDNVIHDRLKKD